MALFAGSGFGASVSQISAISVSTELIDGIVIEREDMILTALVSSVFETGVGFPVFCILWLFVKNRSDRRAVGKEFCPQSGGA